MALMVPCHSLVDPTSVMAEDGKAEEIRIDR
jgi:hypothetical protein